jgi:hypothetical protein
MESDVMLGIIMVIMAVLGAAVSIYGPAKMFAKIILIAVFIVLGAYAVYLNSIQAAKNARASADLKTSLADLGTALKETARIQNLNSKLQERLLEQTKTITSLSRKSIDTTLGGDSFCYMIIASAQTSGGVPIFSHVGKYPLYGVSARIVDFEKFDLIKDKIQNMTVEQVFADDITINLGDLIPDTASARWGNPIKWSADFKHAYNIFYSARNGLWTQLLRIR